MSKIPRRLEYAKVLLREDKIRVEIRDGTNIVQRSPDYFPTQELADKWIAAKVAERIEAQQEVGSEFLEI
jgi:hypothetical protein